MSYQEAKGAIESSINQGLAIEDTDPDYERKELDQLKEEQIRWIAAWLAGDGFGKLPKEETNPYLPEPPVDGKHIFGDNGQSYRCSRCGVYNNSAESNVEALQGPCRGRWAHSVKMRLAAEEKWAADKAKA